MSKTNKKRTSNKARAERKEERMERKEARAEKRVEVKAGKADGVRRVDLKQPDKEVKEPEVKPVRTSAPAPKEDESKEVKEVEEKEPEGGFDTEEGEKTPSTETGRQKEHKSEVELNPMLVKYEELADPRVMQDKQSLRMLNLHFHRFLTGILRPTRGSIKEFNALLRRMHERRDIYSLMMLTRGVPEGMADGKLPDYWMGLLWVLDALSDPKKAPTLTKTINLPGLVEGMPTNAFNFLQNHLERVSRF